MDHEIELFAQLYVGEGCGQAPVRALLDPDLEPERALAAPPPLPPAARRRLQQPRCRERALDLLRRAAAAGLEVLTPLDDRYPERLREAPLRPLLLFAHGDLALLAADRAAVTIVGSRTPTPYGRLAAEDFAGHLAGAGTVVWSGLARGIDAAAHRAALAAGAPTVAVLAGGLDEIYPPEHRQLAGRIVGGGGLLLSEAAPGLRARRGHFPRRNRILAACPWAVLVVEAGLGSGSLHTARYAAEAGTPVFAVPGPYTSSRSTGCHRLLAEGAQIAADPAELLRELGVSPRPGAGAAHRLQLSADECAVLRLLDSGPRPADLVQRESGLDRDRFLRALFALTGRGLVRELPGQLLARGPGGANPVSR